MREHLVQQVGREGWTYSTQVDFSLLAGRPEFQGHTRQSLQTLYSNLMGKVMKKQPALKSKREVKVEDVEEYWRNSTRQPKSQRQIEREQGIVEAYQAVMRELYHVKIETK